MLVWTVFSTQQQEIMKERWGHRGGKLCRINSAIRAVFLDHAVLDSSYYLLTRQDQLINLQYESTKLNVSLYQIKYSLLEIVRCKPFLFYNKIE